MSGTAVAGVGRTPPYRRNPLLETLLEELNAVLARAEDPLCDSAGSPRWPVVFVVGVPRSGTTLVMQWLAASGLVSYPSNLLARFFRAPYVGARIQQMLTDPRYAFRDELDTLRCTTDPELSSDLGKTRGVLAPNEFWYFWRRFFPEAGADWRAGAGSAGLEPPARFVAELALLERAFERPFALKAVIADWNIPFLDGLFPQALFLYIRRDPLFSAQSLLQARERYYGDRRHWYSFRPPEYERLRRLDPVEQVVAQVCATRSAVERGLAQVAEQRRLTIQYEDFCADTQQLTRALWERLRRQGFDGPRPDRGEALPPRLPCANHWRLDMATRRRMEVALEQYATTNNP